MALTKEVTSISADANKDGGVTIVLRLKCWTDAGKNNLVIDLDFPAYIKAAVAGKTRNDLIQEAGDQIQREMQRVINAYLLEQNILTSAKLTTVVATIQSGLTG